LKGFKRETIEKIPKPLRHRTYSSKKQPEIGKTRDYSIDRKLSKATIRVVVRRGVGITAAHLHCALPGVNGAIVVPLFNNPAGQDVDGELDLGDQAIVENADITPPPEGDAACGAPLNNIASLAFAILTGRVYANVHSIANPDGVVRGQLLPILVPAPSQ
jgi:CHRD domain